MVDIFGDAADRIRAEWNAPAVDAGCADTVFQCGDVCPAGRFLDLLFLERQVTEGEVVSDLKDAVLEMRREEKNLFLYRDMDALTRADEHAALSLKIVQTYWSTLDAIVPESDLTTVIRTLDAYHNGLARWKAASDADRKPLQDEIRALGHQVNLYIESLSSRERRMLESALQESQWLLLLSLLMIGLAIYLVGRWLKRVAVAPLKQLESQLRQISEGHFDHLAPPSDIDPAAMAALLDYDYPGNIRELENIMERAVTLGRQTQLSVIDLPPSLVEHAVHVVREEAGRLPTLAEREADYIRYVLERSGQNRTRAAKILGIDRVSLWRKLKKHGMEEQRPVDENKSNNSQGRGTNR